MWLHSIRILGDHEHYSPVVIHSTVTNPAFKSSRSQSPFRSKSPNIQSPVIFKSPRVKSPGLMESPKSSRSITKSPLKNSQEFYPREEEVITSATEKKVQEWAKVEVHRHDIDSKDEDSQSDQNNTQENTGEGQGHPDQDQGQGHVEKHVHVTKSVVFVDESGNVENTRTEMTRTFSNSMSELKVQPDEDFFD